MHHIKRGFYLSRPTDSLSPSEHTQDSRSSTALSRVSSYPTSSIARRYSDLQSIPQSEAVDFSEKNSPAQTPEPSFPDRRRLTFGRPLSWHLAQRARTQSLSPQASLLSSDSAVRFISAPNSVRSTPSPTYARGKPHLYQRLSSTFHRSSRSDPADTYWPGTRSSTPLSGIPNPSDPFQYRTPTSGGTSINSLTRHTPRSRSSISVILGLGRPANPAPPSEYSTYNNSLSSIFIGPIPQDEHLRKKYFKTKKRLCNQQRRQLKHNWRKAQKTSRPTSPTGPFPKRPRAASAPTRPSTPAILPPSPIRRLARRTRTTSSRTRSTPSTRPDSPIIPFPDMPITKTTTTRGHKSGGGLMSKLTGTRRSPRTTTRSSRPGTTTTTVTTKTTRTTNHAGTAAVHHHKRKTTMGDKVSGAITKMKGSLTGKPGVKAAGTRRMKGTDGRGARRY